MWMDSMNLGLGLNKEEVSLGQHHHCLLMGEQKDQLPHAPATTTPPSGTAWQRPDLILPAPAGLMIPLSALPKTIDRIPGLPKIEAAHLGSHGQESNHRKESTGDACTLALMPRRVLSS